MVRVLPAAAPEEKISLSPNMAWTPARASAIRGGLLSCGRFLIFCCMSFDKLANQLILINK
jgi:hypothetical protein